MFGSLDNFITSNSIASSIAYCISDSACLNHETLSVKSASLNLYGSSQGGRLGIVLTSYAKANRQISYLITPDTNLPSNQLEAKVQHICIENINFPSDIDYLFRTSALPNCEMVQMNQSS